MPQPPLNDNKPPLSRRLNRALHRDADISVPDDDDARSFATDAPPGGHMGAGGDPSEGKRD